jgi:CubicO group peptidase (beta-lactamase class C family)
VDAYLSQTGIPGVAISVQRAGQTVYRSGRGAVSLPSGPAPTPTTTFQIDSLTKSFTAMAVLRLAEQGLVELDARLDTYISVPNPLWAPITVRQLLGMCSGIPDAGSATLTYKQVLGNVAQRQTCYKVGLNFEPGTCYEYSNCNYFLLGEIVDAVSPPRSFGTYTHNQIVSPMGMTATGLIPWDQVSEPATPYMGTTAQAPRSPISGYSGGGFVSNLTDLEAFAVGLYQGKGLQPETYRLMWTPVPLIGDGAVPCGGQQPCGSGSTNRFGLGWEVYNKADGTLSHVQKNGSGYGWGSEVVFDPSAGVSVVVLMNGAGYAGTLADDIAKKALTFF